MLPNRLVTLWWTYKKQWKITIFHGKIHYFYGHFPLLFVSSPGRVGQGRPWTSVGTFYCRCTALECSWLHQAVDIRIATRNKSTTGKYEVQSTQISQIHEGCDSCNVPDMISLCITCEQRSWCWPSRRVWRVGGAAEGNSRVKFATAFEKRAGLGGHFFFPILYPWHIANYVRHVEVFRTRGSSTVFDLRGPSGQSCGGILRGRQLRMGSCQCRLPLRSSSGAGSHCAMASDWDDFLAKKTIEHHWSASQNQKLRDVKQWFSC